MAKSATERSLERLKKAADKARRANEREIKRIEAHQKATRGIGVKRV